MQAAKFWRSIPQRYQLEGVECQRCGSAIFPSRSLCPRCRHHSVGKLKPLKLSGEGTVEVFSAIHNPPAGFELQVPYVMAIVKLKEGPKITTQIVDVDPEHVKEGMKVKMVFRRINQDGEAGVIHYGYKFAPG